MRQRIPVHVVEAMLAAEQEASEELVGSDYAYETNAPESEVLLDNERMLVFRCRDGCLGLFSTTQLTRDTGPFGNAVANIAGFPDEQFWMGRDMFAVWYARKSGIPFDEITKAFGVLGYANAKK